MTFLRVASASLTVLVLAGSAHAQRYELSGQRVALYNLAGSLRIEMGNGSVTVVEVTRRGRDAEQLTVRTNALDGVPTLRVIYPADEIVAESLEGSSSTTLSVDAEGSFGRTRNARRVRIRSGGGKGSADALRASADINVRLPAGVHFAAHLAMGEMTASGVTGNLTLESSAGDIEVLNVRGDLELESASGNIGIVGATAQSIRVEVASGSIDVEQSSAENIELESASGNIRVVATRATRLNAETASGDVRAELAGDVRDVELESASGSVEAVLATSFAGEVELETASGDIEIDFPLNITTRDRHEVRGTVGNGGSARVSLGSASGDVRLLRR